MQYLKVAIRERFQGPQTECVLSIPGNVPGQISGIQRTFLSFFLLGSQFRRQEIWRFVGVPRSSTE